MTVWVDVVARARGLGARLLPPAAMGELARARDVQELGVLLAGKRHRPAPESTLPASELEAAERQRAAVELRVLERWIGSRKALRPLFESEDCRSLRALIRGAAANTSAEERLGGLIPTSSLPQRTLAQLAAAGSPATMAALLDVQGHPFGPALLAASAAQQPDLFRMEHALVDTWAHRARRHARRAGRAIRTFVQREIDLANCWSALLVVEHELSGARTELFVEGGALIPKKTFVTAVAETSRAAVVKHLDPLVRHTPLSAVTSTSAVSEEEIRAALAREQQAMARRDPLGPAAVIEYWLRLRGEVRGVQRIIWTVSLGAPLEHRIVGQSRA